MQITFKKLYFQNFGLYQKKQEFLFQNGMDILSARNGTGKSSIWSALFYSLFGKKYSKLPLSEHINKVTKKKLLTEVYFDVNGVDYKIIRGMKPSIFEIYKKDKDDFELLEEQANTKDYQSYLEENILKINDSIFRQLVTITANMPNSKAFMELTPKEKEEIFQIITDTSIFSDVSNILKTKIKDNKSIIQQLEYKKGILNANIKSTKINFETIEKKNKDFQDNHNENISQIKLDITRVQSNIDKLKEALTKLKDIKIEYDKRFLELSNIKSKQMDTSKQIREIESKINYINSAKKNAIECSNCRTTNYLVEVDVNELDNLEDNLVNLKKIYNDDLTKVQDIQIIVDSIKEKLLQGKRVHSSLEENKSNLEYFNKKLNELNNIELVDIDYSTLEDIEKQLKDVLIELKEHQEQLQKYIDLDNIVGTTNLKGEVLKTQIPLLNRNINQFLELFSLMDYNFLIDERFKEVIIKDSLEYKFDSLGNGQKARISLSIMFAFLRLVEERNGVKTNLLVLDEVLDSSLDFEGKEELLGIIKSEFNSTKNVVIISHLDEIKQRVEMFDRIFTIESDEGSVIKREF